MLSDFHLNQKQHSGCCTAFDELVGAEGLEPPNLTDVNRAL